MHIKATLSSLTSDKVTELQLLIPFQLVPTMLSGKEATPENHPNIMEPTVNMSSRCFTIPCDISDNGCSARI